MRRIGTLELPGRDVRGPVVTDRAAPAEFRRDAYDGFGIQAPAKYEQARQRPDVYVVIEEAEQEEEAGLAFDEPYIDFIYRFDSNEAWGMPHGQNYPARELPRWRAFVDYQFLEPAPEPKPGETTRTVASKPIKKVIAIARASALPEVQEKFDQSVIGPMIDPTLGQRPARDADADDDQTADADGQYLYDGIGLEDFGITDANVAVTQTYTVTNTGLADLVIDQAKVAFVPGEAFGLGGYGRFSFALGDEEKTKLWLDTAASKPGCIPHFPS